MIIFQACRIPVSKATVDQRIAGIGFDKGCSVPKIAKLNPAEPNPVKPDPQTAIEMEVDSYLPDATKTEVFQFDFLNKPRICLIFPHNQKKNPDIWLFFFNK